MKTSGTEIPNQRTSTANMEPNGTAAALPSAQRIRLSTKKMEKIVAGYRMAVYRVHRCHCVTMTTEVENHVKYGVGQLTMSIA